MTFDQDSTSPTNDNSNPQQGTKYSAPPQSKESLDDAGDVRMTSCSGGTNFTPHTSAVGKKYIKVPPTRKDSRKLFVGGIASNVTDEDFLGFFQQFGAVVDSVVMFDKETRRSRGFGFVTFEDLSVAQALLNKSKENPGTIKIKDKVCELKAAEPKAPSHNTRPEQVLSPKSRDGRIANVSTLNSQGAFAIGRHPSSSTSNGYSLDAGHSRGFPGAASFVTHSDNWMHEMSHMAPAYHDAYYGHPHYSPPYQPFHLGNEHGINAIQAPYYPAGAVHDPHATMLLTIENGIAAGNFFGESHYGHMQHLSPAVYSGMPAPYAYPFNQMPMETMIAPPQDTTYGSNDVKSELEGNGGD